MAQDNPQLKLPAKVPRERRIPLEAAAIREHLVKVLYLTPYDRSERAGVDEALKSGMLLAQSFILEQMSRYGFGEKTIHFEEDRAQPGTPLIHHYKETNPVRTAAWFRGSGPYDNFSTLRQSAAEAGFGSYPGFKDGEVWVIVGDINQMHEDGTIDGRNQSGAGDPNGGSGGGACVIPDFSRTFMKNNLFFFHDLRSLATPPVNLGDDLAPYLPGPGPYNLVYGKSYSWYEGDTVSALASAMVGSVVHELSHGLGLGFHDFKLDINAHGNLMGNGFRGIRGYVDHPSFHNDMTRLSFAGALQLNASRFLQPAMDYADNTAPVISAVSSGRIAQDPDTENLKVTFTAQDAQSTLSLAIITGLGVNDDSISVADEIPLSGKSGTWTFNIYDYIPDVETAWTITVFDASGNAATQQTRITAVSTTHAAPPVPYFSASSYTIAPWQSVTFDSQNTYARLYQNGTYSPEYYNVPLMFQWDLDGDGLFETAWSTNKTIQKSYNRNGTYFVRLKVKDDKHGVSVSPPIPIKVFGIISAVDQRWRTFE